MVEYAWMRFVETIKPINVIFGCANVLLQVEIKTSNLKSHVTTLSWGAVCISQIWNENINAIEVNNTLAHQKV